MRYLSTRGNAPEQRFRTILAAGLKKEGSLDANMLRTVEELLSAVRQQSVADYADLLKQRPQAKPTKSASNNTI